MHDLVLSQDSVDGFLEDLVLRERAPSTVCQYKRDLSGFLDYVSGRPVDKSLLLEYKRDLQDSGRAPSSVNSILSAVNGFLSWAGRPDLRLGFLKIQKRVFRDASQDLTRKDYEKLVDTAYAGGKTRLGLLLETLGSTGMRVSELKFVTVESVRAGVADIDMKGKLRTVMIPRKLGVKLLEYCMDNHIASGHVFITKFGTPMTRQSIWRDMKALAVRARIPESKVYPHNFRHMFATVFYSSCHDIVKLADVLGHGSIDTTRIYLISSGREHARQLDRLDLVR